MGVRANPPCVRLWRRARFFPWKYSEYVRGTGVAEAFRPQTISVFQQGTNIASGDSFGRKALCDRVFFI